MTITTYNMEHSRCLVCNDSTLGNYTGAPICDGCYRTNPEQVKAAAREFHRKRGEKIA